MKTSSLRYRLSASAVAIATFALTGGGARVNAAILPPEELLPQDTLAVLAVPTADKLLDSGRQSPDALLWNDPAMKPFRDKFMGKFTEQILGPMEEELGMPVGDLLALPQGQLALAITADGNEKAEDGEPACILLLDAKDKSDRLKEQLATMVRKHGEAGQPMRTENIGGLDFTVLTIEGDGDGAEEAKGAGKKGSDETSAIDPESADLISYYTVSLKEEAVTGEKDGEEEDASDAPEVAEGDEACGPVDLYLTQYDTLLVAGTSPKALATVAIHLNGGNAPSLADDEDFAKDKAAHFAEEPLFYGWVGLSKGLSILTAGEAGEKAEGEEVSADAILKATGLSGLKSASFAAADSADGSTLSVHLNAPEATRAGLVKMLAIPAKDSGIPDFVPADATAFSRVRLDGKKAWETLQDVASGISPDATAGLNAMIDMVDAQAGMVTPGFDTRAALFENLGDDIIAYSRASEDVLLVAVKQPDKMISGIKVLAGMVGAGEEGEPREFLGHRIHAISLAPLEAVETIANGAEKPEFIYISEAGGYLAVSQSAAGIEEYLRNSKAAPVKLSDSVGIAEAARKVGGTGGGFFSYQNDSATLRATFQALKDGDTAAMVPEEITEWLDFSLLPHPDTVAKYFGISVAGMTTGPDGITLKSYSARQR